MNAFPQVPVLHDYRANGLRDGEFLRTDTGVVYLLEGGGRWTIPDPTTLRSLGGTEADIHDIRSDAVAEIPDAGLFPSLAISGVFYVDNEDGRRNYYYAERGNVFLLDGTESQVETYFGSGVPLAAQIPVETQREAFTRESSVLALAAGNADNWLAIREYLKGIQIPPITDAPGLTISVDGEPATGTYTSEGNVNYQVTKATQRIRNVIDRFPVISPVADAIWPGAVVQGNSLASGLLAPVQIEDRARGTLTVTTELVVDNHDAPTSVEVQQPGQAAVTTARRRLMDGLNVRASAGRVHLDLATVRSEQQMSARLGVNLQGVGWSANADVSVAGSLETSKTALQVVQEFYTVTFEPSGSPARYFGDGVIVDDLRQYSGDQNPPCYVHQVTYGRNFLFTIQSSDSSSEVEANVRAAWKAVVSGDVNLQASYRASTSSYNVQLATVGVTGATAFRAVGSLMDALTALSDTADYGPDNPGDVISYSVRYLLDSSVARAEVGPYTYTALVRADVPVEGTDYEVWDDQANGVPGGRSTGLVLRPGDRVTVTAFGQVWAGWLFGDEFPPRGDPD